MHRFKKQFGQNFLKDLNILKKIAAEIKPDLNVIEIGPGQGALTEILTHKSKSVFSIEIDKDLEHELTELKNKHKNFDFIIADFLEYGVVGGKYDIAVGNIPYYISTDIIFKIMQNNFSEFVLMVQKEYADRLTAQPGTSQYSKLTVSVNSFYDVKKAFEVSKNCFYPIPKVDSAVVCFKSKGSFITDEQRPRYFEFLKNCFFSKRKTLFNNLLKSKFDKNLILTVFQELQINLNARAENLDATQFQSLFLKLAN